MATLRVRTRDALVLLFCLLKSGRGGDAFCGSSGVYLIQNHNMSDSETGGDAKRGRARAKKAAEPRSDNSEEPKAKRGRGRPKGTAKKAKKAAASKSPSGGKRGRGRPPKKTVAKESKNSSDQGGSDASEGDD